MIRGFDSILNEELGEEEFQKHLDFRGSTGKSVKLTGTDGCKHSMAIISATSLFGAVKQLLVVDIDDGFMYEIGLGYIDEYEISDDYHDPLGIIGKKAKPVGGFDHHDLDKNKKYKILSLAKLFDGEVIVGVEIEDGVQTLPLSKLEIEQN